MTTNIRQGVVLGTVLATLYSAYVLLLYSLRGRGPFEENDVTLPAIVSAYYAGGIIGGAFAGFLWPLVRWRLGATFVGIVVAFFVFVSIITAIDGGASLYRLETYRDAAVIATLVGSVAANLSWRKPTENDSYLP